MPDPGSAGRLSRLLGRRSNTVLGAAVLSGVAGYGVLIVSARALAPADNAQFLVFWGAMFSVFGVLIGVTTETTRAVHVSGAVDASSGLRVLHAGVAFGGVVAAVTALTGFGWAPHLFGARWPELLGAMCAGIALFAVHVSVAGVVSGTESWRGYSLLIASEPGVRLLLSGICAAAGAGVGGIAWAVALAAGTWAVLTALSRRYRQVFHMRVDLHLGGFLRRVATAGAASGVSAMLLVGYPVLLRATTPDDVFARAAPIILAVSLCRAPLLVPLGAYQNVVVTRVISHGLRALVPVVSVLGAITVVAALAAWPLGPWLLHVVNPAYDVAGPIFAALVVSAGLVALLTVTGAATVALDHHSVYLAGWIAATLAALAVLLMPWGLDARVVGSLLVGPVVGVAVHLGWGHHRMG